MLRRIRSLVFVMVAAAAGAFLGRLALNARQRMEAGEPATAIDPASMSLRVQDVVPGLVAAFRVKDAPWSWFHIPSWLAAFAVNFGMGALGGDLARLRERAERTAFEFAGLDPRDFGRDYDSDDYTETYEEAEFTTTVTTSEVTDTPGADTTGAASPNGGATGGPASASWPVPPPNPTTTS